MQIFITECWQTRVTIIDKYLSCLRNQAQSLETGTQHYLKFQTLDTQVLPSPLSLVGTLLTWLALLKAYPCLPSHPKTVHASFELCGCNSMLIHKNNQSTAKQQKQWPLLQWSHSAHSQLCFKWSSRFCSLKARSQLRPPQTYIET